MAAAFLFLLLAWLRYIIVRLFILCGIFCITPILLLILLELFVLFFRLVTDHLPSSVANRRPTRQSQSSSVPLGNLASVSPDVTRIRERRQANGTKEGDDAHQLD
ncbi:hypothetical protein DRE_03713 [Drechslerella stenobrocha 248]|uniref:Uncharacterized protein n=1 Tax=Drechslerella stenobrocha 248 TaxID=1043628 RepID=W7HS87_9PEZI|nr:hypothetical protein DRE_03713 [Drechslerella stenobrocha 248]